MTLFRERVWPAPWLFIATALVVPASLLVFLPINFAVGVGVALVLYAGCVGLLLMASPLIEVTEEELVAGRARLPRTAIAAAEVFRGEDARRERGTGLDARAWLCIRGWVDPVVKVTLRDENDPTPYWLLSTRRPDQLASALEPR